MQINWNVLRSILHCPYKAWQIQKNISEHESDISINTENQVTLLIKKITPSDKLAVAALGYIQKQVTKQPLKPFKYFMEMQIIVHPRKALRSAYQSISNKYEKCSNS